ncbi:MAG TPA: TetR/AcrR family transcriptional regulator [Nitrososphaera sp.]|nr:TetR/AcrR family transcriptional regulator [Nitrososphaera sp.]
MPKVTSMYKAEVKEKIIQAAIESFSQTGFDRTKMEDIAKRLGLSKGTIYLYFKSKEDLFLAICEYNIQKGDKEDAGLFVRKENVASDAEQIYDNIRRREQGNDRVMLEMVAESARNPKLRKAMYELHVKVHEHVMQGVRNKVDEGFLRKDVDAVSLAIALVALYDGLAVNRMLGLGDAVNKRAWVTMIKAMIAGST